MLDNYVKYIGVGTRNASLATTIRPPVCNLTRDFLHFLGTKKFSQESNDTNFLGHLREFSRKLEKTSSSENVSPPVKSLRQVLMVRKKLVSGVICRLLRVFAVTGLKFVFHNFVEESENDAEETVEKVKKEENGPTRSSVDY